MAEETINQQNEDTSPTSDDYVATWDVTTGTTKKVTLSKVKSAVMQSNPYKFSAYKTGGAQTVSASTLTKVTMTGEDFDTNNNFASSTYTVPVAGFYQINARVSNNGNGAIFLTLYKNGSELRDGGLTTIATGRSAMVLSEFVQLAANDTLDLYVYSDNTTITGTVVYDTARMSGFLVSLT